jgi:glycosyltransferase involved in cell wall biosynthesis
MIDFTVAIPTYNGEKRLPDVLDRLRSQDGIDQINWEIIVVDNNSNDGTADLVKHYQETWHHPFPLRYIKEPRQGAAYARHLAATEARGQWIGFLDDDNLPTSNWVAAALAFAAAHPQAGAIGSQIHGDFEVPPPPNFKKIAPFLAIIERGAKPHLYEPRKKILPPGAGVVVQKQVWLECVPEHLVLNNQGKDAGLASEDLEAMLHIQNAGWEIWYNPTMEVYHKIPKWRFEQDYLVSLYRCVGLSRHRIRMLSTKPWKRPLAFVAYLLVDSVRFLQRWQKSQSADPQPLITACELELYRCSLISPFFLLKKRILNLLKPVSHQPNTKANALFSDVSLDPCQD